MQDAGYTIFFAFGCFWTVLAVAVWVLVLKAEGLPLRLDKWGLVVALPIIIPLLAAYAVAIWAR